MYENKIRKMYELMVKDSRFDKKGDAADFLLKKLDSFPKYINSVISMEIRLPIYRGLYEGEEFRDRYAKLDHDRRTLHDSAIDACCILNRLSKEFGIEPFAQVDISDRYAVANFIGDFIGDLYYNRKGISVDQIIEKQQGEYLKVFEDTAHER